MANNAVGPNRKGGRPKTVETRFSIGMPMDLAAELREAGKERGTMTAEIIHRCREYPRLAALERSRQVLVDFIELLGFHVPEDSNHEHPQDH